MQTMIGVTILALAPAPLAAAAQGCHPRGNETIITIVADPAIANRPGTTPLDQFASHQDQTFAVARAYSSDALGALALDDVAIVLPYDGQRHTFTGRRLAALLRDAGAAGRGVTVQGIDGYHIDFSAGDLATLSPILALCRDGQRLGIGDLGPGFLVFAPHAGEKPSDEEFGRMVWGVYFLRPL
jgi:hypothetical protein